MTSEGTTKHLEYLDAVALSDCEAVREKEATYQGSWKKRGGIGAFMMLARKWDRLEGMLNRGDRYDLFEHIIAQGGSDKDGMVLAEVRDLRRYLLLVEAEMAARGVIDLKPASGDTAFKGGVDPTDVYSILAAFWDLDREAAKKRALQLSYGGSPEDGGHHDTRDKETRWSPWVVDKTEYASLDTVVAATLYRDWAADAYVLVPHLTRREEFQVQLQKRGDKSHLSCYSPIGAAGIVLDVAHAPAHYRECWPVFASEYNEHEISKQLSWVRHLYSWNEASAKWTIKPEHGAWTHGA